MKKVLPFVLLTILSCNLVAQVIKSKPEMNSVPPHIQQWQDEELAKAKNQGLVDYKSSVFFSRDSSTIVGYIKNYNPASGLSTGMIYHGNIFTREESPLVVKIQEDGRFEVKLPMTHPRRMSMSFSGESLAFYIEPGQTLAITLSGEEFEKAGIRQKGPYNLKDVQFKGPAAEINYELHAVEPYTLDVKGLREKARVTDPVSFKSEQIAHWQDSEAELEFQLKGKDYSEQSKAILRNEIKVANATYLFNFLDNRRSFELSNSLSNEAMVTTVDSTFYDFLHNMALEDQTMLITEGISVFLNRFEYMNPFRLVNTWGRLTMQKSFDQYLFEDLNIEPTEEDLEFLSYKSVFTSGGSIEGISRDSMLTALFIKSMKLQKRYPAYSAQYKSYAPKIKSFGLEMATHKWALKDTLLKNYFSLQPNLIYDICKVRSLEYHFKDIFKDNKDEARTFLTSLESGVANPFLIEESERFFNIKYPAVTMASYDLPEGIGNPIFQKIIDNHKGKILIVDFWATSCAPCISTIKQLKGTRAEYLNDKDFEFIFITAENQSPEPRYGQFVEQQDLVSTYRLSEDDFKHLRELFKFNGIPRYVLISKDGKVLNDDFPIYNLASELKRYTSLN